MKQRPARNAERLLQDVEWARLRGLGPRDLVPMLERVLAAASDDPATTVLATRHLAEALISVNAWRAAKLARDVIASTPDDGRAWGILGLAYTALGQYRSALKAQRRAFALAPDCASTAHNLGHLLDVAFDRPAAALGPLACAFEALPGEPELAASYAHALARVGRGEEARKVLAEALDGDAERALELVARWSGEAGDADPELPGDDEPLRSGRGAPR